MKLIATKKGRTKKHAQHKYIETLTLTDKDEHKQIKNQSEKKQQPQNILGEILTNIGAAG